MINTINQFGKELTDKIIILNGRNMKDRVAPYGEAANAAFFDKSNPLAAPYFTQAVKDDWPG